MFNFVHVLRNRIDSVERKGVQNIRVVGQMQREQIASGNYKLRESKTVSTEYCD